MTTTLRLLVILAAAALLMVLGGLIANRVGSWALVPVAGLGVALALSAPGVLRDGSNFGNEGEGA